MADPVYLANQQSESTTADFSFYKMLRVFTAHSRMEHYFFSYLLTCENLEIMAQMLQYIFF